MGGARNTIEAETIKELEQETREWLRPARERGWDVRLGYNRDRVEETEDGYKIEVWVHT